MTDHYEKSERAAEEGAHVAVILYKVLCLENVRGMDYRQEWERSAVGALVKYRGNLKKETDRRALDEFLAIQFGDVLYRSGYEVDITAKIGERNPGRRKQTRRQETTGDVEIS